MSKGMKTHTARKINISTGQQPPFSIGQLTGTDWSVLNGTSFSTGQNACTKVGRY